MTHVAVSEETRDKLKVLKKEKGLISIEEVIKRMIKKCGGRVS